MLSAKFPSVSFTLEECFENSVNVQSKDTMLLETTQCLWLGECGVHLV